MNRSGMSCFSLAGALLCAIAGAIATGCTPQHHLETHEAPYDLIATAAFDSAGPARTMRLPAGAYRWSWWWSRPMGTLRPMAAPQRIDSVLVRWLADSSATKRDTLIVTFADTVTIPRFPEPNVALSMTAGANPAALATATLLIHAIQNARAVQYTADSLALTTHYDAQVLERFWLTQALEVVMPLGKVDSLSHRPGVVWIQPNHSGSPPPTFDGEPANDPAAAHDRIVSEPYYNLGLSYGWVSLLDTGVNAEHESFAGINSPFQRIGDCVDGNTDCGGGNPADITAGHGTSSAAILAANNPDPVYARHRGVTAAKLDDFRVYGPGSTGGELIVSAALRGFQTATARLDRVIVAEMQDNSVDAAAIPDAAEGAFDAGSVIIAANGNNSHVVPDKLSFPACARRVIGVGARHILNNTTLSSQTYGLTTDRRQKPDLQAPTSTESAGATSPTATYFLGGTSGATPYAGGGAALLRNWLVAAAGSPVDPGQVYAQLILAGKNPGPSWPAKEGVGEIALPTDGWCMFGKIELTSAFREVDIPIDIQWGDIKRVEAALWWPEKLVLDASGNPIDTHNDVNLHLLDPGGLERGSSTATDGVFERINVPISVSDGVWHLKIDGANLRRLPQVAYWTVALRRQP